MNNTRRWFGPWYHYAKLRHVTGMVGPSTDRHVVCSCGSVWR